MQNSWSPASEINKETESIKDWSMQRVLSYSADELLKIHRAVTALLPAFEETVEAITDRIRQGGRLITVGAGGSGVAGMSVMREIPQNHEDLSPEKFTYRVAGGSGIFEPLGQEELEDSYEEGEKDTRSLSLTNNDSVILISASGRTPYTRAAAAESKKAGALTIGLVCSESELLKEVDIPLFLNVGPEMFVGATCQMAATAQKHALDMIMNGVVIKLEVTEGNVCRARLVHDKARIRHDFFSNKKSI